MAVIRFTESDKLAGKIIEKGYYPAVLTKLEGPQASASKKSINYFGTFRIIKGSFMNKEFDIAFSSGSNSSSILGTMQWTTHRDLMKVEAAALNVKYDDVPLDLDTDTIIDKPLTISVDTATSEGNLMNFITGWYPAGYDETTTAVF